MTPLYHRLVSISLARQIQNGRAGAVKVRPWHEIKLEVAARPDLVGTIQSPNAWRWELSKRSRQKYRPNQSAQWGSHY